MKQQNSKLLVVLGLILCIIGQVLRIGAQQTAKSNFNHDIQTEKSDSHELVTNGVYSISRHPSYLGFYLHSVGGQIIQGNKLMLIIFLLFINKYYKERINHEEKHLVKIFGDKYIKYREKVPIGIPFFGSSVNDMQKQDL